MSSTLLDQVQLSRSPGIGPVTFRQLLQRFGSASQALAALPDLARRGGGAEPRIMRRQDAELELARVEKLGARYLVLGQGLYPRLLAAMEDAPPLLIVKGELKLLDRPAAAMVGARNASAAACRFARGLAHDLGREGLVVVSGLARGVDAAAHDASNDILARLIGGKLAEAWGQNFIVDNRAGAGGAIGWPVSPRRPCSCRPARPRRRRRAGRAPR